MKSMIVLLNIGDVFRWKGKELQVQDPMSVMDGKVSMCCAPEGKSFLDYDHRVELRGISAVQKVEVVKTATPEMRNTLSKNLFGTR